MWRGRWLKQQGSEAAHRTCYLRREPGMSFIATVWQWLRAEIGDHRLQFRLCLRVTVAAVVAFLFIAGETLPR